MPVPNSHLPGDYISAADINALATLANTVETNTNTNTTAVATAQTSANNAQSLATAAATPAMVDSKIATQHTADSSTYRQLDKQTFISLGDSRMNRDGGVNIALGAETIIYRDDRGICNWFTTLSRHRLKFLFNGGVGGDTVAQMLARLPALLTTYSPGWVIGFGHINSVSANLTVAQITTDLDAIFTAASNAGAKVVWGTDWAATSSTTAQQAVTYGVNEWLRGQSRTRKNLTLVDFASVFIDPTTGFPFAGYTTDGLHQEPPGAIILGTKLHNTLTNLIPPSDTLLSTNADPTNLLTNGMLVGVAANGAASGFGIESGSTGTLSKVARADGYPGEWQQVAAGVSHGFYHDITAGFVVGDVVYAEVEFETDAASWVSTKFELTLNMNTSGADVQVASPLVGRTVAQYHFTSSVAASTGRPASGILRTGPIVVPAGATNLRWAVRFAGTSGTYRLARASVRRVV